MTIAEILEMIAAYAMAAGLILFFLGLACYFAEIFFM